MNKVDEKTAKKVLALLEKKGIKLVWTHFKDKNPVNAVAFKYDSAKIIPGVYSVKVWNRLNVGLYEIVPATNNTDITIQIDLNKNTIKEVERGYYGMKDTVKIL